MDAKGEEEVKKKCPIFKIPVGVDFNCSTDVAFGSFRLKFLSQYGGEREKKSLCLRQQVLHSDNLNDCFVP